jgi:hypothetical protein
MSRSLPVRAHLGQLKHQAKDVLRAHAKKDSGVCDLLRHLNRFERVSAREILEAPLTLSEAQYALALDYGLPSWDALKKAVLGRPEPALARTDDAVFVRGLEEAAWGGRHPRQNSVLAAFVAAASTFGDALDYDLVMATSGAAFRLQHKWCPSSPHAKCGFDCSDLLARTSGYQLHWVPAKDPRAGSWSYTAEVALAHERVVGSIDSGQAVLWGKEECGLLVGYGDEGDWLLRPCAAEASGYTRSDDWPWYFGVLERHGQALRGVERAVFTLRTAVELAHSTSFGAYTAGFAAYERWARELAEDERFDDEQSWFQNALGNAHTYACLAEARGAAARALERIKLDLPDGLAARLGRAAAAYARVEELIEGGAAGAPRPHQLFPWCFAQRSAWTSELRLAQAAVLGRALDAERSAVHELEGVLAELGVGSVA